MSGMNKYTGRELTGVEHIKQSVEDILTTPLGTRVMRRDYGSKLFDLIDTAVTEVSKIEFYAAVAEALRKWEPRFKVKKVSLIQASGDGRVVFDLIGVILLNGREIPSTMEGITIL